MTRHHLLLLLASTPLAFACGDKAEDTDTDGTSGASDGGDDGGGDGGGDDGPGYVDDDGDGFTSAEFGGDDCDDDDDTVFPGADETCNGTDDDCDGDIDDDPVDGSTFYVDGDRDGFGDPDSAFVACEAEVGLVEDATDCDDSDDEVNPGSTEISCDGIDNDCDSVIDINSVPTAFSTLQDAVDGLEDGSEICVQPNTYADQLDLSGRTLSFVGQGGPGRTSFELLGSGPMITIVGESETYGAGDISFTGFTIAGGDFDSTHTDVEGGFAHVEGGTLRLTDIVFTGHTGTQPADTTLGGLLVWGEGSSLTLQEVVVDDVSMEVAGTLPGGIITAYGGELIMDSVEASDLSITATSDCVDATIYGGLLLAELAEVSLSSVAVRDSDIDLDCWTTTHVLGGWFRFYQATGEILDLSVTDSVIAQSAGTRTYQLGTIYALGLEGEELQVSGVDISGNTWSTDATTGSTLYGAAYFSSADVSHLTVWSNEAEASSTAGSTGAFASLVEVRNADLDHLDLRGNSAAGASTAASLVILDADETDSVLSNFVVAGNELGGGQLQGGAVELSTTLGSVVARNGDIVGNRFSGTPRSWVGVLWGGGEEEGDAVEVTNVQVIDNLHEDGADLPAVNDSSEVEPLALRYSNLFGNTSDETSWGDVTGTNGNISADPLYTDVSGTDPTAWDLSLQAGSPATDAGDPSFTDDDSSPSDMGAYGGPDGTSW